MLQVRPFQKEDLTNIVDYFLEADLEHLLGMGVDTSKLLPKAQWLQFLTHELAQEDKAKTHFYLIWEYEGKAIGHSNINLIQFGDHAFLHLHLWEKPRRERGLGTAFVKLCLPIYFSRFQLKRLYCEPYALNPSPNKTLPKLGFTLEKSYETIPGTLSFKQEVNRWVIHRDGLSKLTE